MQTLQWLVTLSLLGFPALSQHNPDPRKPLSLYKPQRRVEETGSYFIDAHMPTHIRPSCKRITQNRTNTPAQLLMSNAKILSLERAWPSSKPPPVIPSDKAHRLDKEYRLAPWTVVERKQIQVETPGEGHRVRERREDALKLPEFDEWNGKCGSGTSSYFQQGQHVEQQIYF